jgi:hypothetical protein
MTIEDTYFEEDLDFLRATEGRPEPPDDWLTGTPLDPLAVPAEPLPALPGLPFAHRGSGVVLVGATGGGRSSLIEAGLYDAARAGLRCAYLGCEVTPDEFNARAADLAKRRGHPVDDDLRSRLASVRYLDLPSVIVKANTDPGMWARGMIDAYDIVAIDPLSAVASALGLDFDKANSDYVSFHDRLVQPLIAGNLLVIVADNIGHSAEAKNRAKGASAKQDRADIVLTCAPSKPGLVIRARKVRSIRAPFSRGDEWLFEREARTIREHAPERAVDSGFRPTAIMENLSRLVEQTPGLGANEIRDRTSSRAEHVTVALQILIAERYVEVREDGQKHAHHSTRQYRQLDDPAS